MGLAIDSGQVIDGFVDLVVQVGLPPISGGTAGHGGLCSGGQRIMVGTISVRYMLWLRPEVAL